MENKIKEILQDYMTKRQIELALPRLVNLISVNVPVSRSFHGRDEEDSAVIEEAKKIWTTEHQGKLKAVKHLMAHGWGLKVAHDYCRENFG
jgi:hypothetical protein